MGNKSKGKKCNNSDSESDVSTPTYTKIKKIYKCCVCNKKIKNYCKCGIANTHPGSNIITIMTNPDNENKNLSGQKGEKGDRGLTGSMGISGNSFLIFGTNKPVTSGDFIGVGYSDKEFNNIGIQIPYDFFIKQIGITIRTPIKCKCVVTLYVNNKPTDFVVCLCDGIVTSKSFNPINKIKSTELFCFRICVDSCDFDKLTNGVSISMVMNN